MGVPDSSVRRELSLPDVALSGRRLLIVEDDYFWAHELLRGSQRVGAMVLGPVGSIRAAVTMLDLNLAVDGAILDIDLRGQQAYAVADRLIERQVPFLFVTGYDAGAIPGSYAAVPRFEKPVTVETVLEAMSALLPAA